MAHLRPCTACLRHVRADVTSCPFCDSALAIDTTTPAVPHERLGRAARMAFGGAAAIALTVAGCESKENIAMPYGAPPTPPRPEIDASTMPVPPIPSVTASSDPVAVASDASAAATASATAKPPPTVTARPPPHGNMNKPYGAPPADGYDVFDV